MYRIPQLNVTTDRARGWEPPHLLLFRLVLHILQLLTCAGLWFVTRPPIQLTVARIRRSDVSLVILC